jgi:hypothetical protein
MFKKNRNVKTHADNDNSVSDVAFGKHGAEATTHRMYKGVKINEAAAKADNPKSGATHFKKMRHTNNYGGGK